MRNNSANDSFLVREFERLTPSGAGLDYGCGAGHLISYAVRRGLDFWGAETYYGDPEQWQPHVDAEIPDDARDRIRLLDDRLRIPFDDATFDFVCSNQVLEHVKDIAVTASEIARVTKLGGYGIHLFPLRETIVEAHIGVPFFHRIPRRLRRIYARPWHRAKIALYSHAIPDWDEWFTERGGFFENHVHLRSFRDVKRAFDPFFAVQSIEAYKLGFHLGHPIKKEIPLARFVEHRRVGAALLMLRRD